MSLQNRQATSGTLWSQAGLVDNMSIQYNYYRVTCKAEPCSISFLQVVRVPV